MQKYTKWSLALLKQLKQAAEAFIQSDEIETCQNITDNYAIRIIASVQSSVNHIGAMEPISKMLTTKSVGRLSETWCICQNNKVFNRAALNFWYYLV